MTKRVMDLIHPDGGVYECVPRRSFDDQGWASGWGQVAKLLSARPVRLAVEVGVWKGALTLKLVPLLQPGAEYVCVDTWLGSPEFWTRPDERRDLWKEHGYPTVYYTFLSNIVLRRAHQVVTPFPVDSLTAAECFRHWELRPEFVFLDASHEFPAVVRDIDAWWPLVAEGGVLAGDDMHEFWPDVECAVRSRFDSFSRAGKVWWKWRT